MRFSSRKLTTNLVGQLLSIGRAKCSRQVISCLPAYDTSLSYILRARLPRPTFLYVSRRDSMLAMSLSYLDIYPIY